ncbi:hypothetical protein J4E83_008233 [Alternaria metachromatica]|uniref:uncharacterized protein n=1 Tax=Alternaria metachromatica TaxID=283354 RepID=UPI0020C2C24D|nr:uncharacterized protein J4E83_008233 [Alternaria metachromatica]KAI4610619.1 hypothetical protein J4E83_008233 [Alternaria metachromatica]
MESCYVFRTWAGETLTIACAIGLVASIAGILAVYDGKPVPDWGGDLNLNALIALLSTVLRALLVLTVAQIISQRKWDWFNVTSARPLSDIQRFDYGSRGAYGALLLIPTVFLKDFVTLAAAVVLLLSFLVGPFAQQANGAAPCSFPSATLNASLPFAHTVPGSGGYIPFTGGSDGGPTTDLVAAILSSVVSPYGIENKIRTSCATGNCTFSNLGPRPELEKAFFDSNQSMHSTVGMCNVCTNVASLVTSKIESTEWSNNTVHSLPSGLNLSVGAGHFEVSTIKPTPDLTWMGSLLTDTVREASRWAYVNATLLNIGSTPITASVCSLYPCTRTYKSFIKDSELHEWEVPSSAMRIQISGAHHEELDLPTYRNSLSNVEYEYTTRREPCRVGPWTLYAGDFIPDGTATAELQLFDFSHEKYAFENMTWPEQCIYRQPAGFVKAVAMVMNDDIFDGYCQSYKTFDCFKNCKNSEFCQLESQSNLAHIGVNAVLRPLVETEGSSTHANVTKLFDAVANAMTNRFRFQYGSATARDFSYGAHDPPLDVVYGLAWETKACVEMRLKWLLVPICLTVATCILSVWVNITNWKRRHSVPIWKDSILPLVFYGQSIKPQDDTPLSPQRFGFGREAGGDRADGLMEASKMAAASRDIMVTFQWPDSPRTDKFEDKRGQGVSSAAALAKECNVASVPLRRMDIWGNIVVNGRRDNL